jgi:hypothetical protein
MRYFWAEKSPKFEDKNKPGKFSAEMEFGKIGPWRAIRTGMWNTLFQSTPLK